MSQKKSVCICESTFLNEDDVRRRTLCAHVKPVLMNVSTETVINKKKQQNTV